ncbi:hypothetical protein LTR09_006340 [Extremus antarcticus]|uniref:SMP-LTD domain-containing protein n=1 Tax=Extremus antarcticus TaxID=702011 RepID=A0AAJ0GBP5_9PEZI|nr:hypothetical protein LTR09_006340 [Extremus antarcticus]
MTLKALLYVYVLGGLTFIPLVLVAILIPAWLLLQKVEDGAGRGEERVKDGKRIHEQVAGDKELDEDNNAPGPPEAAAEATFAVLRAYDFPAANAALNARHTSGNTAGGVTGTTDRDADGNNAGGSSVYQSVYRSVFATSKNDTASANHGREVLENDEPTPGPDARAKRKTTPANVFYIVLRHGHLMLYDSPSQMEVRHVISLAHHSMSLSEGGSTDVGHDRLKDADLFIKRTAIVLTPIDLPNGGLQSRAAPPKPFYLFSTLCSEKEDFYHALLYTRTRPPIPEPLEPNDVIKLQSTLHSTSLTPETRAFNALVGRVFLGIYHTPWLKHLIQSKIEKKISRVQKPSFLAELTVKSVDLGNAAPVLSNPRLKDLNISGDMTVAVDVRYTGAINITVSALAKLDLGPRFKTRTVDLVLATSLQRLHGQMLFRIKPPPSNRIWFCFESPPEMDVKVEPVVSQRKISYTFILRAIEDRIRAVVTETLVKPNWDDVPFFNTMDQNVRGGIWRDEGGEHDSGVHDTLWQRNQKTNSMPALPLANEHESSAGSSGSETTSKVATGASTNAKDLTPELKRRSVASLPARSATNMSATSDHAATPELGNSPGLPPPKPLRSPSFTSPAAPQPSVALDESSANMDPGRAEAAQNASRRWRLRQAAPALPARKNAAEAVREMRDRVLAHREAAEAEATQAEIMDGVGSHADDPTDEQTTGDERAADADGRRSSESPSASLKSFKRTDTNATTASSVTNRSSQQQRKTILAATAAATNAARNWSWNALANARTKGSPNAQRASSTAAGQVPQPQSQPQPMGRGQPLPPPGVPLPGPQKGLFGGLGTVRRKPVARPGSELPATRSGTSSRDGAKSDVDVSVSEVSDDHADDSKNITSDEFGPWTHNSGLDTTDTAYSGAVTDQDETDAISTHPAPVRTARNKTENGALSNEKQEARPPLPARPEVGSSVSNSASERSAHQEIVAQPALTWSASSEHGDMDPSTSSEDLLDLSKEPAAQLVEQLKTRSTLDGNVHHMDYDNDLLRLEPGNEDTISEEGGSRSDEVSEEIVAIPAPVDDDDDGSRPTSRDIGMFSEAAAQALGTEKKTGDVPA